MDKEMRAEHPSQLQQSDARERLSRGPKAKEFFHLFDREPYAFQYLWHMVNRWSYMLYCGRSGFGFVDKLLGRTG